MLAQRGHRHHRHCKGLHHTKARSAIVDDRGSNFVEAQSNFIQQHTLQSDYNTLEYYAGSPIYLLRADAEMKTAAMIDLELNNPASKRSTTC